MVMLRILKNAEPAYYKEISPAYSIEMQAVASDPQVFRQWVEKNRFTVQIYTDMYFDGDVSHIESLRRIIID